MKVVDFIDKLLVLKCSMLVSCIFRPSGAFAGKTRHVTVPEGECYFWRTIGCSYGDRCRNLHKPECKGVDRKPRHH